MLINHMKQFTGVEYLAIDVANCFGKHEPTGFLGDKATFEDRIKWVQDHFSTLEKMVDIVDEDPILYKKAVLSLKRACNGEDVGHMVALDACCSGIQIMSALTGCKRGAYVTGLIDPEKRMDAYTIITETMNKLLQARGITSIKIARSDAKDAIMPCIYGSTAKPEEYFGGVVLEVFYEACFKEASGAFELLETLRRTWQAGQLSHTWQLPDGFVADIKVMQPVSKRVRIEELNGYNMTIETSVNMPADFGISNVANVIHSVDGYVLREVVRRCNYNHRMVTKVAHIIREQLKSGVRATLEDEELSYYFNLARRHACVSIVVINHITADNVNQLHPAYLKDILDLLDKLLTYTPFMVTTVHDAFACLPNNCNILRYWYRELLAELNESDVLECVVRQITHNPVYVQKRYSASLADQIRRSNYGLC